MMSKSLLYKVFILLILLSAVLVGRGGREQKKEVTTPLESFQTHQMFFYEAPLFMPAVKGVEREDKNTNLIKGGVIPHHLMPAGILARFFNKVSSQSPKRILLIGPNHPEKGGKVLTTDWGWDTPFGALPPDQEMTTLFRQLGITIDHEIIEHEHSVAGMMPFIKYFLPGVKVSTLILSNNLTLPELNQIADNIVSVIDEETIIIAPIDFSHYLSSKEAQQKDKVTWESITKYNYQSILSMNNDNVDGRTSLVLELLIMEKLGYTKINLYEHTNSGEMMNDPYSPTTSYFSFGFVK